MPCRVASCPVVGILLAATPAPLRTVITELASPSLASTVALILLLAVNAVWKIVWPLVLSHPGAMASPASV